MVTSTLNFSVTLTCWGSDRVKLSAVRRTVFIEEQSVPEELELDENDADCEHVLATLHDGTAIGAGRLMPDGRIGRMAVIRQYRGHGVGLAMLELLVQNAQERKLPNVHLHSQCSAIGFYEKLGFIADGDIFQDAGIDHRNMRLNTN